MTMDVITAAVAAVAEATVNVAADSAAAAAVAEASAVAVADVAAAAVDVAGMACSSWLRSSWSSWTTARRIAIVNHMPRCWQRGMGCNMAEHRGRRKTEMMLGEEKRRKCL